MVDLMNEADIPASITSESEQHNQPKITEIQNLETLVTTLIQTAPDYQAFSDRALQENLANLFALTQEGNWKLFVIDFGQGVWSAVAPSKEKLLQNIRHAHKIALLQTTLRPEYLNGNCIYVHDYAASQNISEGNIAAIDNSQGTSVYRIRGIHEIGYLDRAETKSSIYFDLTSKAYIFSPTETKADQRAVCDGLIVIDDQGSTSTIEKLYATHWKKKRYDPSRLSKGYIPFMLRTQQP